MSGLVLDIAGLSVTYALRAGVVRAVQDVSLRLGPGERLGLVGESGSGKTTTALAVMGMLREPGFVETGSIRLDGTELVGMDPKAMARLRLSWVSYVPQGAMNALNPVLRVRTSLAHAIRAHESVDNAAMARRTATLLEEVGLPPEVASRYPHELSGGMKQRVCIALAIALSPRLIIADEPTSALDVVTQRHVMRTLQAMQARVGAAMILIGHDMGLMAQSVDRVAVMRNGRLVEDGGVRQVFAAPSDPYTAELIHSVPVVGGATIRAAAPASDAAAGDAPLLALHGVSKSYGGGLLRKPVPPALHPLDFELPAEPARIVAVVGQSGSGKTTLGSLVLGFTPPSTGRVLYRGQDVTGLRGVARRAFRREVQAVFQDPYSAFNPFYRVEHGLITPLRSFGLARTRDEARPLIEAACRQVGLDPALLLGRFAHELSGGQRQRLMVARAMMLAPRLLVADEPVSMVDASLRASILDLLVDLRDRHGISILYITHDLATAYRVADDVLVLHRGRVVERGDPAEVFTRPRHPYTSLLLDCLPWPDPERPWGVPGAEGQLRAALAEAERVDA